MRVSSEDAAQQNPEAASRLREQINRSLLESSADCVKILDLDARLLLMNRAGQDLLELDDFAQVAGACWIDLWGEADHAAAQVAITAARNGKVGRFEGYLETAKGVAKWWDVAVTPILGEGGQPAQLLVVSRDVTAQHEAEQEVLKQAALLDLSPDAIIVRDLQSHITFWSKGAETLYGWPAKEVLGHSTHELFRTQAAQPLAQIEAELLEVGHWEGELTHLARDGQRVIIASRWQLQRDLAGQPAAILETNTNITERRQAEAALREAVERQRMALDAGQIGTWEFELTSGRVNWDERVLEMFGLTRETFDNSAAQILRAIHAEDRPGVEASLAKAVNGRGKYEAEFRVVHPDGAIRWLYGIGQAQKDSTGRITKVFGYNIDITERKQGEQALAKANQRIHEILIGITDAFMELDRDWRFVEVNQQAAEFLGHSRAELLGQVFWELFPQGRETEFYRQYHRAMARQQPIHFEGLSKIRLNTWFEAHAYPSPDSLTVYFRDITERKQVEEKLRYQLHLTRNIADTAAISIFVSDAGGRVTFLNPEAEKTFGFKLSELAGEVLHDRIHQRYPDGRPFPISECALGRIYRTGEVVRDHEDVFFRKDDSPIAVVCSNAPLMVEGKIAGSVLTVLDITERKQAEAERARLLAGEQEARSIAQAANLQKDEFIATVSHELKNPLNAILGWTQLIQSGRLNGLHAARAIEIIDRNAGMMNRLIEDLLDSARIIAGKLKLERQPIDVAQVVLAALDAVRPSAEAKEIKLETVLSPLAEPLLGDPVRLQQVVWNLLTNAIKFTPWGGRVIVKLERRGARAEITVCDSGQGIKPEFLPHIFDRYRQADDRSTSQHKGLGLGLAIVRHLAEMHGGTVSVASEGEGQGATFTVSLPLLSAFESAPQVGQRNPAGADKPVAPLTGVRVLVVDDEPDARMLLNLLLQQEGATVTTSPSAASAFALLETDNLPDVLISDIGMPVEDGYSFIRRVRDLPPEKGGQLPAIAVTAFSSADDRALALAAGFQIHCPKPIDHAQIVQAVTRLLPKVQR